MIGSVYMNYDHFSPKTRSVWSPEHLNGITLLVFWGGGDIHPQIYGEPKGNTYGISKERDSIEVEVMREALGKIPILGICRGAQLGCVMTGGSLYQDVNNHTSPHAMDIGESYRGLADDCPRLPTNSLHHQMMIPGEGTEVIATSRGTSDRRLRYDRNSERFVMEQFTHDDPEVLVNVDKKLLMVQGHPEFQSRSSPLNRFTDALVKHFFGIKLA